GLVIYNTANGAQVGRCGSGSSCSATVSSGTYAAFVGMFDWSESVAWSNSVTLGGLLPPPTLTFPVSISLQTATPTFSWTAGPGANPPPLTVATSAGAPPTDVNAIHCSSTCAIDHNIPNGGTSYTPPAPLASNTTYYWEVQGFV